MFGGFEFNYSQQSSNYHQRNSPIQNVSSSLSFSLSFSSTGEETQFKPQRNFIYKEPKKPFPKRRSKQMSFLP